MERPEWHEVVELVAPHVVRIWTPQGSGTGFLVLPVKARPCARSPRQLMSSPTPTTGKNPSASNTKPPVGPSFCGKWTGPSILKAIRTQPRSYLSVPTWICPRRPWSLQTRTRTSRQGSRSVGLATRRCQEQTSASSRVALAPGLMATTPYLVDGVAINGVSGGPAFFSGAVLSRGRSLAYIPNRNTGEVLPGLAVVRGVSQFHDVADGFRTLDEAKAEETPPTEPPPQVESDGLLRANRGPA